MLAVLVRMLRRHEGRSSFREFRLALTTTDVASGCTVNQSAEANKAAIDVVEDILHATAQFPFPILGIGSDYGSEFIDTHLYDYCVAERLAFSLGQPGNKNDGSNAKQYNWAHGQDSSATSAKALQQRPISSNGSGTWTGSLRTCSEPSRS